MARWAGALCLVFWLLFYAGGALVLVVLPLCFLALVTGLERVVWRVKLARM